MNAHRAQTRTPFCGLEASNELRTGNGVVGEGKDLAGWSGCSVLSVCCNWLCHRNDGHRAKDFGDRASGDQTGHDKEGLGKPMEM